MNCCEFVYTDKNGQNCRCNLTIYQNVELDGIFNDIVIVTYLYDELGKNTTNSFEDEILAPQICKSKQLNPEKVIWIDHWDHNSYKNPEENEETFDLIEFKDKANLRQPYWKELPQELHELLVELEKSNSKQPPRIQRLQIVRN